MTAVATKRKQLPWKRRGRRGKPSTLKQCPPPDPVEPFYQKLEYELLQGKPDGREAESGEKEREAPPAP